MDFLEELRFLKEQLKFDGRIKKTTGFDNVVIAGMGGSGIAARIFQGIYSEMPVYVIDDYEIPEFVSDKTLFIGSSYSGNTEEVVSTVQKATEKGAYVVTISSGGHVVDYGDERIRIPRSDLSPRSSTGYMLVPLLTSFGIATNADLEKAYKLLEELDNDNKECAAHADRIFSGRCMPVIYGVKPFDGISYRWKTQFNENSKLMAYSSNFPELNHNDTLALLNTYDKEKFYFMVFGTDDQRITKRIDATSKLTKTKFNMVNPKGSSVTEKLFYLLHYGDYVSYHVALKRGLDPGEMNAIQELKRMIGEKKK